MHGSVGFPRLIAYTNGDQEEKEIVMECFETNLLEAQNCNKFSKLVHAQVQSLMLQLLDCVQRLHEMGYVHGDMKPDNICLSVCPRTDKLNLFLIDFGMATKYTDSSGHH